MKNTTLNGNGRCLGSLVALLALAACWLPVSLFAQEENPLWIWSPKQVYHEATVKVEQNPFTGSGILVGVNKSGTQGLILTANHLVEKGDKAAAIWRNGYRSEGQIIARDKENDLAVFICDPPEQMVVAAIATELPPGGEVCDHTGWGSNRGILRRYLGRYMHEDGFIYTGTSAVDGDSGGGVWYQGKLIGIISGGKYTAATIGEGSAKWELAYPVKSASVKSIRTICERACPPQPKLRVKSAGEDLVAAEMPPNYFQFLGEKQSMEPPTIEVDVELDHSDPIMLPSSTKVQIDRAEPPEPQPVAKAPAPAQQQVVVRPQAQPVQIPQQAPQQIVVNVDTATIANKAVKYIVDNKLLPQPKVDNATIVLMISERLRTDEMFAKMVAKEITPEIEKKVIARIGQLISGNE